MGAAKPGAAEAVPELTASLLTLRYGTVTAPAGKTSALRGQGLETVTSGSGTRYSTPRAAGGQGRSSDGAMG
jgi:hypothetical protein